MTSLSIDPDDIDPDDPIEVVNEHRDLFERLADSDLPVAPRFQRALERADKADMEGQDAS